MTEAISKLLTVEDVMATLRISRPTLYRLLKAGNLIPVRIGKRTLFDPADIRAFVDASKQAGPSWEKKPPKKSLTKKQSQPGKTTRQKDAATPVTDGNTSGQVLKKSRDTKQTEERPYDDEDKQGRLL